MVLGGTVRVGRLRGAGFPSLVPVSHPGVDAILLVEPWDLCSPNLCEPVS